MTPEQVLQRRRGIGASDVAAAVGASRYMSRYGLWLLKTGRAPSIEENWPIRAGNALEPIVLHQWCQEHDAEIVSTQRQIEIPGMDFPLWATLDAEVVFPGETETRVVEVKTTTSRNSELGEDPEQVPLSWVCQCQIQAMLAGVDEVTIACLVDTRDLRTYTVPYSGRISRGLLDKCREFWRYVATDTVPPPDWADVDERLDRHRWIEDVGEAIDLPRDITRAWEEYEGLGEQIRQMTKRRDSIKADVVAAIGDARCANLGDGRRLRTKTIHRKGYVVKPSEYVTLRVEDVE